VNINATLIGQMLTFALFVWFTMKFIWPPVIQAMAERKKKIADGLAAAERGVHELEVAHRKVHDLLSDAKVQAAGLVEQANKRAARVIEEAKNDARTEGERIIVLAREEVQRELQQAREQLRQEVAQIAVASAEKILQQEITSTVDSAIIDKMIADLKS